MAGLGLLKRELKIRANGHEKLAAIKAPSDVRTTRAPTADRRRARGKRSGELFQGFLVQDPNLSQVSLRFSNVVLYGADAARPRRRSDRMTGAFDLGVAE